jgi:hypothetical protein
VRLVLLAVAVVGFDCCNLDATVAVVHIAAVVVDVVVVVIDDHSTSVWSMIHLSNDQN